MPDLTRAADIVRLLAVRHADDVFVPECKDGPSQGTRHFRMDAWAMRKSWANPVVTGYEVKVSRGDFLADKKWPVYLRYCNEFYIACPAGVVEQEELPAEVGLIHPSSTGSRLIVKKKAGYRSVEIPESLYRYILMCRVAVLSEHRHLAQEEKERREAKEYWRGWMEKKVCDHKFGRMVGKTIRQILSEQVESVRRENARLVKVNNGLAEAQEVCSKLGIDPAWVSNIEAAITERASQLREAIPRDMGYKLERLRDSLNDAIMRFNNVAQEGAKP